ncbi:MAG: hypothetical protein CVU09_17950 [Bacteroidetes bacterium HGW-Bacteroidetes-4]|jgi:protein-disulfide isomerase|nr:MAG: hypothetical protein CVU09_17950 [Bacteroidetes bacterium HGW-Bacteroidetes-4]
MNISPELMIDSIVFRNLNENNLIKFAKQSYFDTRGIPVKNTFKRVDINTPLGKESLLLHYKESLMAKFLDSLKKVYDIKINLTPPIQPLVNMNLIHANYKGNLESEVTFWLLSDIECQVCKEAKPIYDEIYDKYNNSVKFAFSYYSSEITLSSLALESAKKQGKFWEMYERLNDYENRIDNNFVYSTANEIGLNMTMFNSDIQNSRTYKNIEDNYKNINDQGFYGTPTVIVNNRVILDSFSKIEIENRIEEELNKNKNHTFNKLIE